MTFIQQGTTCFQGSRNFAVAVPIFFFLTFTSMYTYCIPIFPAYVARYYVIFEVIWLLWGEAVYGRNVRKRC